MTSSVEPEFPPILAIKTNKKGQVMILSPTIPKLN